MFGRFFKLHFLLAAFIAFLSPHYVLPRLSSFETPKFLAAPGFVLSVPTAATANASSRTHQTWVIESAKHGTLHATARDRCIPPAIQTWTAGSEFGVTYRA